LHIKNRKNLPFRQIVMYCIITTVPVYCDVYNYDPKIAFPAIAFYSQREGRPLPAPNTQPGLCSGAIAPVLGPQPWSPSTSQSGCAASTTVLGLGYRLHYLATCPAPERSDRCIIRAANTCAYNLG